jgi:alkylation response protein AidB-like acyl-CoA dehydrogenase
MPYKGKLTERFFKVRNDVVSFINEVIEPATETYTTQQQALTDEAIVKNGFEFGQLQGGEPPILEELRSEAKKRGLYNFFLPEVCGLTVLEYSPIAELLGAYPIANAAMNCSAPDTGNMEVLEKYGTAEQKKEWLEPLLEGKIRSAFAMTEPGVASSDATNISTRIERDGDDYVINGHKWWISGAIRPECKVFILMGKTKFDGVRTSCGPLHSHAMPLYVTASLKHHPLHSSNVNSPATPNRA